MNEGEIMTKIDETIKAVSIPKPDKPMELSEFLSNFDFSYEINQFDPNNKDDCALRTSLYMDGYLDFDEIIQPLFRFIDDTGANLAYIEDERYIISEYLVSNIVDRLENYYKDYVYDDLKENLNNVSVDTHDMTYEEMYTKSKELGINEGYCDYMEYMWHPEMIYMPELEEFLSKKQDFKSLVPMPEKITLNDFLGYWNYSYRVVPYEPDNKEALNKRVVAIEYGDLKAEDREKTLIGFSGNFSDPSFERLFPLNNQLKECLLDAALIRDSVFDNIIHILAEAEEYEIDKEVLIELSDSELYLYGKAFEAYDVDLFSDSISLFDAENLIHRETIIVPELSEGYKKEKQTNLPLSEQIEKAECKVKSEQKCNSTIEFNR